MATTNEILIEVYERLRQQHKTLIELSASVAGLEAALPKDQQRVFDAAKDQVLRAASLSSDRSLLRYSEIIEKLRQGK